MAVRKSILGMSESDRAKYREAVTALKSISAQNLDDERGYFYFAGLHGLPVPTWCEHGNLLFLPWHRAYLYFYEFALQEALGDDSVGVPWWDWLGPQAHTDGIPEAFAAEQAGNAPNSLARTDYELHPRYIDQVRAMLPNALDPNSPDTPRTVRRPRNPRSLPTMDPPQGVPPDDDRFNVRSILDSEDFTDFSLRLEGVHGWVHVWVGGAMARVPTAAFDPIFWSHHSMVDRIWYLWQLRHSAPGPDASLWDIVLTPFPVTVRQMLNIDQLSYEYTQSEVQV